jgi:lysozyme family protein
MTDRFEICLPFTLRQECPYPDDWENPKNFSNDSHDPGGETWCGIIQREYDAYRKAKDEPCRDVSACTQAEGYEIYRTNYWLPYCPTLPPGLDLQFFDASVNMGCVEATRILQRVLGLNVDGEWGPKTAARTAAISSRYLRGVIAAFTARRSAVYRLLPGFRYFGKGWLRRAEEIGEAALKMAAENAA